MMMMMMLKQTSNRCGHETVNSQSWRPQNQVEEGTWPRRGRGRERGGDRYKAVEKEEEEEEVVWVGGGGGGLLMLCQQGKKRAKGRKKQWMRRLLPQSRGAPGTMLTSIKNVWHMCVHVCVNAWVNVYESMWVTRISHTHTHAHTQASAWTLPSPKTRTHAGTQGTQADWAHWWASFLVINRLPVIKPLLGHKPYKHTDK